MNVRRHGQHYARQMKRKYQEDPFAFMVLWALFFSAIFLVFAFRGLIAVQFMRKINVDPNAHLRSDELLIDSPTDQSSSAESPSVTTQTTSADTTQSGNTYTVKDGDTLYAIAQQLGKDWKKMAEVNGLEPPYSLSVGQTIKLP